MLLQRARLVKAEYSLNAYAYVLIYVALDTSKQAQAERRARESSECIMQDEGGTPDSDQREREQSSHEIGSDNREKNVTVTI